MSHTGELHIVGDLSHSISPLHFNMPPFTTHPLHPTPGACAGARKAGAGPDAVRRWRTCRSASIQRETKSWFIKPMNTIVIGTINHSYWSYVHQLSYLGGLTLYIYTYYCIRVYVYIYISVCAYLYMYIIDILCVYRFIYVSSRFSIQNQSNEWSSRKCLFYPTQSWATPSYSSSYWNFPFTNQR